MCCENSYMRGAKQTMFFLWTKSINWQWIMLSAQMTTQTSQYFRISIRKVYHFDGWNRVILRFQLNFISLARFTQANTWCSFQNDQLLVSFNLFKIAVVDTPFHGEIKMCSRRNKTRWFACIEVNSRGMKMMTHRTELRDNAVISWSLGLRFFLSPSKHFDCLICCWYMIVTSVCMHQMGTSAQKHLIKKRTEDVFKQKGRNVYLCEAKSASTISLALFFISQNHLKSIFVFMKGTMDE